MFRTITIYLLLSTFSAVVNSENIKVVGDINEKPRIYLENTEPKGHLPTILRYIEENTDLVFDVTLYPWARAYFTAESGKAAIVGLSKTEEREKLFDYTAPIYFENILVISTANNPVRFNGIEDLYGKTIGVARGAVYSPSFEKGRQENLFKVIEDNRPSQRLNLLLYKRIDVAIMGSGINGFNSAFDASGLAPDIKSQFIISNKPLTSDPNYIGFPKSMKASIVIDKINHAVVEGYASGELQKRLH